MGYSTDLFGTLKTNRQMTLDEKNFLTKFADTRRMARKVDTKYGVEGEFYVDGSGMMGQDNEDNIINYNTPPKTQPSLWCQWVPTEDGRGIEWDGNEKFYKYVEWLQYLIDRVFPYILEDGDEPLVLNGEIEWRGEEDDDIGRIVVKDNKVTTLFGEITYPEQGTTRVFFVTDGPIVDGDNAQNEELHETLEQAEKHAESMTDPRIRVCIVRNAFREADGWNYDDLSNTFETIKTIKE